MSFAQNSEIFDRKSGSKRMPHQRTVIVAIIQHDFFKEAPGLSVLDQDGPT